MTDKDDKPKTIETLSDDDNVETIQMDDPAVREFLDPNGSQVPEHTNFWCISLMIVDIGIQMVINLSGDLMLGRQGTTNAQHTFIDLTAYGAHQHGVSRQHAIISLQGSRVVIKDNQSSNHTYLNEKQLKPHQPYPLKPGDRISLGKLKLQFNLIFDPFAI